MQLQSREDSLTAHLTLTLSTECKHSDHNRRNVFVFDSRFHQPRTVCRLMYFLTLDVFMYTKRPQCWYLYVDRMWLRPVGVSVDGALNCLCSCNVALKITFSDVTDSADPPLLNCPALSYSQDTASYCGSLRFCSQLALVKHCFLLICVWPCIINVGKVK